MDIAQIFQTRWKSVAEGPYNTPLYQSQAGSNMALPYAVVEYNEQPTPINSGRAMAETTARVTIYDTDERRIESLVAGLGLSSIVPKGLHRVSIGTAAATATSQITDAGLARIEPEPPLGGGKCWSRTIIFRVRSGSK